MNTKLYDAQRQTLKYLALFILLSSITLQQMRIRPVTIAAIVALIIVAFI